MYFLINCFHLNFYEDIILYYAFFDIKLTCHYVFLLGIYERKICKNFILILNRKLKAFCKIIRNNVRQLFGFYCYFIKKFHLGCLINL